MKKLLISLIILMNLIIVPVFADDFTVLDTAETAVTLVDSAMPYFGENFERVYNYAVNNNYIIQGSKYVLFPAKVEYDSVANQFLMTFQLLTSSSANNNDKFVVISHNSVAPSAFPGHYDFWVGYTGSWVDITANTFFVTCSFDGTTVSQNVSVSDNTTYVVNNWGMRWQTNFIFDSLHTRYLLVSDFQNVFQFGGLYYSIYSSQDLLPTYYQYFLGSFASGLWNDYYTLNPNYVISVYRSSSVNVSNINTEVYVTSNSIIFDNNNTDSAVVDYNIDALWGTLKNSIFNLLAGLSSVIALFTVIFSWLPFEFTSLIYAGLLLATTLLIIRFIRGG